MALASLLRQGRHAKTHYGVKHLFMGTIYLITLKIKLAFFAHYPQKGVEVYFIDKNVILCILSFKRMKIPIPKLKAMIRYFATCTDSRLLGKKKLMKLFYFVDFSHVKKYGFPITHDRYVHLEHGPIPSAIMNLVSAVETDSDSAILADILSVETREGSLQKRMVTTKKFTTSDEKYFSPSELSVMKSVCERFSDKTGKYIEDASHKEAAWDKTDELEDIPYTLAALDPDSSVNKEEIELALKVMG